MRHRAFALPVVFLLLAALGPLACRTARVSTDYDPEEDFSGYETFAWLPQTPEATGDPRLDNPLVHRRVREAIERTLQQKGFRQVEADPDFWVAYHLAVEQRIQAYTVNRYYAGYGWGVAIPETRIDEYDEGTLVIDVADADEKELVWRGVGTRRLRSPPGDPEKQTQIVQRVVDEVLEDFPPGGDR